MDYNLKLLQQKASGEKKENRKLFKQLSRFKPSKLDQEFHVLHDKYMAEVDCLDCGNCCRSISPAVKDNDISRLARYLKTRPSELTETYFDLDEEGDYVFRSQPCPFIGDDNYCSVYDARPKACREYPHTDRTRMHQVMNITFRNISICPVVYEIVRELREEYS